ncbi:nucleotidyltransferase family protein [Paenibacillus sp. tmac-D7]|uniref:nucleotidyltransferase family protein n=1 Tax=Paenibacillus sp. tmac-D7 TaxID=2591462 RepID=UPI001142A4FE|nr:nucleotidyltransferase family protein [Paenibacillus sp. tmac-D7]
MHTEALNRIAGVLNEHRIEWGLGGSSLLAVCGLDERPNDIDLLVAANDAERAHELLRQQGSFAAFAPKEPFCTTYFYHYTICGAEVDVMGLFGIRHESGTYRLDWRRNEDDRSISHPEVSSPIPLTPLEEWFVVYLLIPGKSPKADRIEQHWLQEGRLRPHRLRQALSRELPMPVRERIARVLDRG